MREGKIICRWKKPTRRRRSYGTRSRAQLLTLLLCNMKRMRSLLLMNLKRSQWNNQSKKYRLPLHKIHSISMYSNHSLPIFLHRQPQPMQHLSSNNSTQVRCIKINNSSHRVQCQCNRLHQCTPLSR